ncbi:MAG: hemerythrin protein [Sphingobacteriaceae bacterium]|jgi:hemerythrin-like domain-containing protein|nr:hemerythrin protein [Sphingobacteriaceae bacterium]
MKRNINLQELSKDHHHGLLLGWKIRQGLQRKIAPEAIKNYVSYFVNEALLPHFREEEEVIFSSLADTDNLIQEALKEHSQIEDLAKRISKKPNTENLNLLADLLDAHIRFEERTLFPHLEQNLTAEVLESIGQELKNRHQPFIENYPDEFWKRSN